MATEKEKEYTDVLKGYIKNTTIHGLQEFADKNVRSKRGCTWMLLIFLMVISLVVVVSYHFFQYFQYQTLTKVDKKVANSVKFPAITICNLNQYKKTGPYTYDIVDLLQEMSEATWLLPKIISDHSEMQAMPIFTPGLLLFAVINASFHDVSVKHCKWENMDCPPPISRITEYGRCKTYNSDANHPWIATKPGSDGGLRIITDIQQDDYYFSKTIQMGMKVILHEPDEEPFPETHGFIVGPGKSVVATINRNEEVSLPRPYVALSGEYCLDTRSDSFHTKLKRFPTYTQESCIKDCMLEAREENCGCRRFFDPGNTTLCSVPEMGCHLTFKEEEYTDNCSCGVPCVQSWYDYSLSYSDMASEFIADYIVQSGLAKDGNYLRKNMIDLRIYYDRLVVHNAEQVPKMTLDSVLGNLGGIMGLFVGASILSLVQLFEFLFLFLYTCFSSKKTDTEKHGDYE